jgi:uncharacterized protein YjbI with pentapeptide repeats
VANPEHLAFVNQGIEQWNRWRLENPDILPDFLGANLSGMNLRGYDLRRANLAPRLVGAPPGLIILGMPLVGGVFSIPANLSGSDLRDALCGEADLRGANLEHASLVNTDFTNANLSGCRVYGIAAWNLKLDSAVQKDLVVTPDAEPRITTDSLEIAQFIYILLHNQKKSCLMQNGPEGAPISNTRRA